MKRDLVNKKQQKPIFRVLLIGLLICFIIIINVLIHNNPIRIAKRNLENVINIALTFPDEDADYFFRSLKDMESTNLLTIESSDESSQLHTKDPSIKDKVAPYLTDKALDSFITNRYTYDSFCAGTSWTTAVRDIKINFEKGSNRMLFFKVSIICNKPHTEEMELILTGRAQYDETGTLNYWKLSDMSVIQLNSINRSMQMDAGILK